MVDRVMLETERKVTYWSSDLMSCYVMRRLVIFGIVSQLNWK